MTKSMSNDRKRFLDSLRSVAKTLGASEFRACHSGVPIPWVWSDDAFAHSAMSGTLADAEDFASKMIGQGMHFAYAACAEKGVSRIWLTAWEDPDRGPLWPEGIEVAESAVYRGVDFF